MWSAGCKASLYIATHCVVLARDGQARQVWSGQPWQHGLHDAAAVLKADKIRRVAVWLSGGMARPFLIPVVQGIKRWREVEQLAGALAPEATHMQDGPLSVWIGRWHEDKPTLAVATEQALHQTLMALKASHGVRVERISPVWRWAATQAAQDKPLMLLHETDACTSLRFEGGIPQWVTSYIPTPSLTTLKAFAARTAFGQGVDASQIISGHINVEITANELDAGDGGNAHMPPVKLSWLEDGHEH